MKESKEVMQGKVDAFNEKNSVHKIKWWKLIYLRIFHKRQICVSVDYAKTQDLSFTVVKYFKDKKGIVYVESIDWKNT